MAEGVVKTMPVGPMPGRIVIRRRRVPSPVEMCGGPPTYWWRVVYRTDAGDIVLGERVTWEAACDLARGARVDALVRVHLPGVDQLAELRAAMVAFDRQWEASRG